MNNDEITTNTATNRITIRNRDFCIVCSLKNKKGMWAFYPPSSLD